MLLGLLMEDYISFLADIASETNIMDKQFYVVIQYPEPDQNLTTALRQSTGFFQGLAGLFTPKREPHVLIDDTTLTKAKTELKNRVEAVMQGLLQCGVQSVPLDTQELIELYYDAYNPDTATRQKLDIHSTIGEPVITKAVPAGAAGGTAQ